MPDDGRDPSQTMPFGAVGSGARRAGSTAASPAHELGNSPTPPVITGDVAVPSAAVASTPAMTAPEHAASLGSTACADVAVPSAATVASTPAMTAPEHAASLGSSYASAPARAVHGHTVRDADVPYAATVASAPPMIESAELHGRAAALGSAEAAGGTLDLPASDRVAAAGDSIAPGELVGRFVVRSRLGEGGMGVVFAGHDADLGRPVAIKLVRPELGHAAYRARLLREAQAMARLEHPNVARVYEVGTDRGRLFVAMEFVDGVTLATWLKVERRPWREIVAMFAKVGAGLAAVHRAGLVHRDFKPENVLVDRDGRPRVVDFGLARLDREAGHSTAARSPELAASLTRSGIAMGTPGFMAPEQQYGGTVDARADQYSFCVALREALVGGRDAADRGWAPRAIRDAIARGLAYEAQERFPTMDELLAALRPRRSRALLIGGAIAGVATLAFIVAFVLARPDEPSPALLAEGSSNARPPSSPERTGPPTQTVPSPAGGSPSRDDAPAARDGTQTVPSPGDGSPSHDDAPSRDSVAPRPSPGGSPSRHRTQSAPRVAAPAGGSGSRTTTPSSDGPPPVSDATPASTRKPAARVGDPGHLAVVRATVKDLGYDGFDPKITVAQLDDLFGPDHAIARVKLGMIERRAGKCAAAEKLWSQAIKDLKWNEPGESEWHARANMGLALCALGAGKPALDFVNRAWVHGNHDQLRLAMAVTVYENGDSQTAYGLFLVASRISDPAVQSGLVAWYAGTGLSL